MIWVIAYVCLSVGMFFGYCLCGILNMNGDDDDES